MKALLYKDLWIARWTILPMLIFSVVICVVPLPFSTATLPLAYGCLLLPCLFQQENREHWYSLAAMLPYSPRALVGSKYLLSGGVIVLLGLACFFGPLAASPGLSSAERLADVETLVGVLLAFYAFSLPTLFFLGPGNLVGAYLTGLAGFGLFGLFRLFFDEAHPEGIPLPLILALLLFLVSFLVAGKVYDKRQW